MYFVLEIDKSSLVKKIYVDDQDYYIINLTDHIIKIITLSNSYLIIKPILQARIERRKLIYYNQYGVRIKNIIIKNRGKIIDKNNPKFIKIVSIKVINFLSKVTRLSKEKIIYDKGWVNPSFIRYNKYYFKLY